MRSVTKLLCIVRASTPTQRSTVGSNIRMQRWRLQGTDPRSICPLYVLYRNRKLFPILVTNAMWRLWRSQTTCTSKSIWKNGDLMTNYSSSLTSPSRFPDLTTFHFFFWGVREWMLFTFQPWPPFCQNLMMGNELLDLRQPRLQMSGMNPSKETVCAGPLVASSLNTRKLSQKVYHEFYGDKFH
jgi:hypothetical protein